MLSIIASVTSINIPGRDDRDRGWKSNKSTGVDKDGAKSSFPSVPNGQEDPGEQGPLEDHGHDHLALREVRPSEAWTEGEWGKLFPFQMLGWSEANF